MTVLLTLVVFMCARRAIRDSIPTRFGDFLRSPSTTLLLKVALVHLCECLCRVHEDVSIVSW